MKKKMIWSFLLLMILCLFNTYVFAQSFDEIVIFGDSLSDNGNLFVIEEHPVPDPRFYYQGRFSNGRVWVEYLSDPERLNTLLEDRAFGGATTNSVMPPGLIAQVTTYITLEKNYLSQKTLFIIWIGGNDCLYGGSDYRASAINVKEALDRLAEAGARHILVLNLPDLGTIPEELNQPGAIEKTEFSLNFNGELANMLDEFSVKYPEISFYEVDIYSFFRKIQNDPAAYGFTNITDPSPNFDLPNNFDGAGYLFWDDIHPTTRMHALIADQVFEDLKSQVPITTEDNSKNNPDDDSENGAAAQGACFIGTLQRYH
jgi:thermolabile hemolysin